MHKPKAGISPRLELLTKSCGNCNRKEHTAAAEDVIALSGIQDNSKQQCNILCTNLYSIIIATENLL